MKYMQKREYNRHYPVRSTLAKIMGTRILFSPYFRIIGENFPHKTTLVVSGK